MELATYQSLINLTNNIHNNIMISTMTIPATSQSTPPLPLSWLPYTQTLIRSQSEVAQLSHEVSLALLHITAKEHSPSLTFRKTKQLADKKRILYAAQNESARAQRRLDRLQKRVGEWDKSKCEPTTPMVEMQGRSAMDILGEIEESLGDALQELKEVVRREEQ